MGVITPFAKCVCVHFYVLLMIVYEMLLRLDGLGRRLPNLLGIRQLLQWPMLIARQLAAGISREVKSLECPVL